MNREDRENEDPVRIIDTSLSFAIRGLTPPPHPRSSLRVAKSTACKTSSATRGWREDRVPYSSRTRDCFAAKWIMPITLHCAFRIFLPLIAAPLIASCIRHFLYSPGRPTCSPRSSTFSKYSASFYAAGERKGGKYIPPSFSIPV